MSIAALTLMLALGAEPKCEHEKPKRVTIEDCIEIADELDMKEGAFRPELIETGRALAECVRKVAGRHRGR